VLILFYFLKKENSKFKQIQNKLSRKNIYMFKPLEKTSETSGKVLDAHATQQ
jgi:hypothetical protein